MGKLKIIQASPLATIQDTGRFGFRKYGIPQSGAIDPEGMRIANQLVGNALDPPVIEFALGGMRLEVVEQTHIGVFGAGIKLNGAPLRMNAAVLECGDLVELTPPKLVYAYLALGGKVEAENVFDSCSTYLPGKFGGYKGRSLRKGDILGTTGAGSLQNIEARPSPDNVIRFMKGPEWDALVEPFDSKEYKADPSSNRIGIRVNGDPLDCKIKEIKSSAVVPGTIQLPPNGQPIILMNDCQTTGGYPRIGKVLDEDLGKLGQVRGGLSVVLRKVLN